MSETINFPSAPFASPRQLPLGTAVAGATWRGALVGAMTGTLFGTCVFPLWGTIVGAVVGVFAGLIGGFVVGLVLGTATWSADLKKVRRDARATGAVVATVACLGAGGVTAALAATPALALFGLAALVPAMPAAMWASSQTVGSTLMSQASPYAREDHLFWTAFALSFLPLVGWIVSYSVIGF